MHAERYVLLQPRVPLQKEVGADVGEALGKAAADLEHLCHRLARHNAVARVKLGGIERKVKAVKASLPWRRSAPSSFVTSRLYARMRQAHGFPSGSVPVS